MGYEKDEVPWSDMSIAPPGANVTPTGEPLISKRQQDYLLKLCEERDLWSDRCTPEIIGTLTKARASDWIRRALEKPVVKTITGAGTQTVNTYNYPDVPAGRYALIQQDGTARFYRVSRPEEGRWAGFTFIDHQAGSDYFPVKNRDSKLGLLRKIAEDPMRASVLYGRLIGACGVCGRTLTNPDSIAAGIGPICREKQGW